MCKLKTTFDELRLFQWYYSRAVKCLTQSLFFLVLHGLVKRSLWDPLVRALRVPIRLPRLVWISSGCVSAIVRRSSRSLLGFGVSLPVALSHPINLGMYKASYPLFYSKLSSLPLQVILFVTYCREDPTIFVTDSSSVPITSRLIFRFYCALEFDECVLLGNFVYPR
jgi:hypothetical protein